MLFLRVETLQSSIICTQMAISGNLNCTQSCDQPTLGIPHCIKLPEQRNGAAVGRFSMQNHLPCTRHSQSFLKLSTKIQVTHGPGRLSTTFAWLFFMVSITSFALCQIHFTNLDFRFEIAKARWARLSTLGIVPASEDVMFGVFCTYPCISVKQKKHEGWRGITGN